MDQKLLGLTVQGTDVYSSLVSHASLDGIEEVIAIGQKMGIPIGLKFVRCRHSRRLPARRAHTENLRAVCKKDGVVRSPRTATEGSAFSDYLCEPTGGRDLLQFACGEETDPAAVRGPKWIFGILSSGEFACADLLHGSDPEHGSGSWSLRAEHQSTSVGRKSKFGDVDRGVGGCGEGGFL